MVATNKTSALVRSVQTVNLRDLIYLPSALDFMSTLINSARNYES